MNGYEFMSRAYRDALENDTELTAEAQESIRAKIKALDFLATATRAERLELFNSTAFNDVVKGYFQMALDNTELPQETKTQLLRELIDLFESKTADEAEDYYINH